MPNSKERRGMDKPGVSSTLWATAAIFSVFLGRRARVLFFTSLTCPKSSNFSTNFYIEVQKGAS
uniref:Uncharacterized protein n=1 Tax=Lepeophtheirus salmonis TaxID=72036 RepID=A0A0K2UKH3_LEPSM